MSVIRFKQDQWRAVMKHLYSTPGEHFVFLHATWTFSQGAPVFIVRDISFIADDNVRTGRAGWEIETSALLAVINKTVKSRAALIEVHNHGGRMPRFSTTDRQGFQDFVPYVLESLPNRPYAATVWGDDSVYAEFFTSKGGGVIQSITVTGERIAHVLSDNGDSDLAPFARQLPWFTEGGQRQLSRLRVAIIGAGGTGSQAAQALTFLGIRKFVIVDFDIADETNMNRLVTATAADIGTPKAILARRLIKSIAPSAQVRTLVNDLRSAEVVDVLKGIDIIFGCVDNDGARLILNELALAYRIPYFDFAVGIEASNGAVSEAGGRIAAVLPDGPCLNCMNLIDTNEAGYFLATEEEQKFRRERGYVEGMDIPAPSVVSLNGTIVNAGVTEFAMYLSGIRPINVLTELDLLGVARNVKSQWMVPTRTTRKAGCIQCAMADLADDADIERYLKS